MSSFTFPIFPRVIFKHAEVTGSPFGFTVPFKVTLRGVRSLGAVRLTLGSVTASNTETSLAAKSDA